MKVELRKTQDGTHTLYSPAFDATYHSTFGARQESEHVFIESGLNHFVQTQPIVDVIRILELGFGTGLNAWLSWNYALIHQVKIEYHGIEKFPVEAAVWKQLNYAQTDDEAKRLETLHTSPWENIHPPDDFFSFVKYPLSLSDFRSDKKFDLVYYDAFGPDTQPELWTAATFEVIIALLNPGAILTTYCSKGDVRRALQSVGFSVEKLPGPPGKREIVRALVL